jgi:carotenoid cleavage dioxygenase
MNASEEDGVITVTGCRVPTLWRDGPGDIGGGLPTLHEWRLDLAAGTVAERPLDDAAIEYPRVADAEVGRRNRFGYVTSFSLEAEPERSEIYKYDFAEGAARQVHRLPAGHTCGEAVFVPRRGASGDDDGYLMTFAHDRSRGTGYLAILDAADLSARPVAQVRLPVRVPTGFHGNWLPSR